MKNYNFVDVSVTCLDHFRVLLLILIFFCSMLVIIKGFANIKKSKMADPRGPPFENLT